MIQTIRVQTIIGRDTKAEGVLRDAEHFGKNKTVEKVLTARVYRLEGVSETDAKKLAEKLLCESINQKYTLNSPVLKSSRLRSNDKIEVIEIGYKPGVMNPEVGSIFKAAADFNIPLIAADVSTEYGFVGKIEKKEVRALIQKLRLFNPMVETIIDAEPQTLLIKGDVGKTNIIALRTMPDKKLLELSKNTLFLNLEEMKVIQNYFKKLDRDPTDCELETIAQTWSEHCSHKTFKAKLVINGVKKEPLMTRLKKEALKHDKHIVSAFVDNAGVMDFYDDLAICGKAETHNAPSAIEPYGGAATGSGGVFRDIAGTGNGAKNIASTDIFCLAPPDMPEQLLPEGCLPPDYMLKRVVTAVKDYGNRMGIPTNNGSFHFHNDFRAKPVVLVGAYGILPKKQAIKGKPQRGDTVISVGGRTGRDGIHGATFSSSEMTHETISVNASAVQIGNAIEEKRVFDALLEARDKNLLRTVQDCGAGGFSSAVGELGEELGVSVDMSKATLKYPGLAPWEIWVSESQERMVAVVPESSVDAFLEVCKTYNVEACILGTFDGNKKLQVYYEDTLVCDLDMEFLYNGLPQRTMIGTKPARQKDSIATLQNDKVSMPKTQKEWEGVITKVLAHPTIASKEPIVRLYDHTVQGTSVLQPFSGKNLNAPNDAAIIAPVLGKPYGVVVAHGLNPILNTVDPYWGSMWAIAEGLANYVGSGGNYNDATLINNYIWPFPDEKAIWSLNRSVEAVIDAMRTFAIPVISGKDSLSATYRAKDGTVLEIPPVLCMSVFGKIADVSKTISTDFKKENSIICLLGKMDMRAMGGSIYEEVSSSPQGRTISDNIPHVDIKNLPRLFDAYYKGVQQEKILAAHDISEGGMITTLFEMCLGGDNGAVINVSAFNDAADTILFNETAGNFLVEVASEKVAHELFKDVPYTILGKTTKEKTITVEKNKDTLFSIAVDTIRAAWQQPMKEYFN